MSQTLSRSTHRSPHWGHERRQHPQGGQKHASPTRNGALGEERRPSGRRSYPAARARFNQNARTGLPQPDGRVQGPLGRTGKREGMVTSLFGGCRESGGIARFAHLRWAMPTGGRRSVAPLQPSGIGAPTSASPPGGGAAHRSAERSEASVSHSGLPLGGELADRVASLDRRSALPCRARFRRVWTTSLLCLVRVGRLVGGRGWWRPRLARVVRAVGLRVSPTCGGRCRPEVGAPLSGALRASLDHVAALPGWSGALQKGRRTAEPARNKWRRTEGSPPAVSGESVKGGYPLSQSVTTESELAAARRRRARELRFPSQEGLGVGSPDPSPSCSGVSVRLSPHFGNPARSAGRSADGACPSSGPDGRVRARKKPRQRTARPNAGVRG